MPCRPLTLFTPWCSGNGAAAGGAGGGEAPLSFRRFLEPAGPVSLGRPDVAAGLPDFVQDHLAPAAAAASTRQPAAAATGTRRKVRGKLSVKVLIIFCNLSLPIGRVRLCAKISAN